MQFNSMTWDYVGNEHCLWRSKTKGLFSHLIFFISTTGKEPDEYLIRTDTNGICNERCIGIENAKMRAQELYNSYLFSQMIL